MQHCMTLALFVGGMSLFSGCGKHEATAGTVGATAGAIIGSSLTDNRNKTSAALLGGVIGNIIGSHAGRAADQEEAAEEYYHKRTIELREREIVRREAEVRLVNAGLDRWCLACHRQNGIPGAHRCPSCGDSLVREKVCNGCLTSFSPTVSYR
ncbi:glycine zipper 2TM domain-containing protein, partial [Candidatus Dependentiae bacterium]|nr:glycine zipper 2TM domain-containing protein [Candidatus Dependentiae bacterium]